MVMEDGLTLGGKHTVQHNIQILCHRKAHLNVYNPIKQCNPRNVIQNWKKKC